jgi:EAL domain-containing protein (putative c-di-GMP-specific phosphodiesterase class I)
VRWQHPRDGLVGPGAFIPHAEEDGLIVPLGEWVLREALSAAAGWAAPDGSPLRLSVNVSARQLDESRLAETVREQLRATGFPPSSLSLEITETVIMKDVQRSGESLRALRSIGAEISIDDFGTGYSSMSYLKKLPVTCLKIDRTFIDRLGTNPHDSAIVTAIVALARALHLRVIAEGVETAGQRDELLRLGCDAAQGFLWAQAMPAEEAQAWVDRGGPPTRS